MTLSVIIAAVVRLFALYWFSGGVLGLLAVLGSFALPASTSLGVVDAIAPFISSGCYLAFSLVAWVFAEPISIRVVGCGDREVRSAVLRRADLYSLGVFIVGLYLTIRHLAAAVNWVHYLAVNRAGDSMIYGSQDFNMYEVSAAMIPCVSGFVLVFTAGKIGSRFDRIHHRDVASHTSDAV